MFDPIVLESAVRLAVPIILASVGCCFMVKVNILNLSLEGTMLISAFFAAASAYWSVNPIIGLVTGILAGLIVSFIFGILTINFHADPIIVGIAINLAGVGLTSVLLEAFFGTRGILRSERIVSFSPISILGLDKLPIVGELIFHYDPIVYLTVIIAVLGIVVMYRTPLGLRIRAIGEYPEAAATAGVRTNQYRHVASLICGALLGLAGAYLPLGGLSMFTENMTAGKGFIALAAALFAWGSPGMAVFASLIYGYAASLALKLQRYNLPSHIVLMTPYLLTLIFLFAGKLREVRIQSRLIRNRQKETK